MRWKKSNKSVFNCSYHIIWCAKYRRKVIFGEVEARLKELINLKSQELDIEISAIETDMDHIHILVKADPTLSIQFIVNQLKGYTSKILRSEFAQLRSRMPSLWTRSYYVDTIGCANEFTIKKYIENQKSN